MENTSIYITVRLDIEHKEGMSKTDKDEHLGEVVAELDYNFVSIMGDTKVVSTEICGIND